MKNFIHLNVKSDNSLLEGYGQISEYIELAKKYNMPGLALTDRNTMTGIYDFIQQCSNNNIKPIPGIEINMAPITETGVILKEEVSYDNSTRQLIPERGLAVRLTLLAKNEKGLKNLFKLTELSYSLENRVGNVPRIGLNILKQYKDDLIVLSGNKDSEINIRFRLNQDEKAYEYASILKEIFKDDFYIEINEAKFTPNYSQSKLIKLAETIGVKPVMTNAVYYPEPKDNVIQECMMCLGKKSKMSETPSFKGGLRPALGGQDRYFKSYEEMKKLYSYDQKPELLDNTMEIFNKIENIKLSYNAHLRPKIEIPEQFKDNLGYLKHLIKEGFGKKRAHQDDKTKKESKRRIKEELDTVIANDFIDYFLVVWDYCKWSEDNGYPIGCGRGSCAGSEIMFLLNITKTDPIRFNLLFERFISPGRGAVYEIEYEDGTIETSIASDKKILNDKEVYVHQLQIGDEIE